MKKILYIVSILAMLSIFPSCQDDCENIDCLNGQCIDGTCQCDAGYEGSDCSLITNDSNLSGTYTTDLELDANRIYNVSGKLVIEEGATLTIGPGVIIKAAEGAEANATAIVIEKLSLEH